MIEKAVLLALNTHRGQLRRAILTYNNDVRYLQSCYHNLLEESQTVDELEI